MIRFSTQRSRRGALKQWAIVGAMAASLVATACGSPAASPSAAAPTNAPAAATAAPTSAPAATTAPTAAPTTAPTAAPTTAPTAAAAASPTTASTTAGSVNLETRLTGAPVPLVVYSAQGYDSAMTKAFQKATGIPTKLVDASTGPLLARIQAEKNNPQWGLLWVDGDEAFAAMDKQNMLVQGFEPNVKWTDQGASVLPKDKSYVPTGLTVAGTIVYNSKTVKTPPKNWQDLLTPAWKGKVGMNNPAISGPTYPFVAGMMQYLGGEQQGKDFYTKLKANGLKVYKTNGVTLHALSTGAIDVAIIQSSAGIGAGLKDPAIKVAFASKSTFLPSVIGIDAKAPAQEQTEAKMFAEYVLSPEGQQVMLNGDKTGDSLYWPVVSDVNPRPALPSMSSVPGQAIDAYTWGPKEAEINQWFTQNIVQ